MPNLRRTLLLSAATLLLASSSLHAQSLNTDAPTLLHSGTNSGTIDSFGGNQFWYVMVGPGSFKLTFTYGSRQEGFNTGGRPTMVAGFRPEVPGATMKHSEFPGGTVYTGTAPKASRFKIVVIPAPGALVRQTTAYTLEATGAVSFSGPGGTAVSPGGAPSVVGVYAVKSGTVDHGVAKFTADGNIATTNGESGHWKLFDAESRVYTVTIGRDHWSLIYQPGRGFLDAQNQNLILEQRR